MKISFINAVATLAESVDGDIEDIAAGMGLYSRIGSKFLRAGLGYGGSCFPKGVVAFSWSRSNRVSISRFSKKCT
jgi:UDPglucose 6-dehydrogenase